MYYRRATATISSSVRLTGIIQLSRWGKRKLWFLHKPCGKYRNTYICEPRKFFFKLGNRNITLLSIYLIKQFKLTPYNNVFG